MIQPPISGILLQGYQYIIKEELKNTDKYRVKLILLLHSVI
ncbi:hypothetical protein COXBURSA331_0049 (plasmid) [Coxiella burnetii RSA 331]|nr:hypothetical protein COXBURSA331_0049 [Coxiella burnetii RSA 331]AIT64319.1 hypothetical protein CBNA_2140 [Coxiella burnetii str. Namibia]EAX32525.1 hypothetical protein A35_0021 [Coxiella burnetii 'MSU Goat Q177']